MFCAWMWMYLGTFRIRLSDRISKHQQLKNKSATTDLSEVLASMYNQTTPSKPHSATRPQESAMTPAKRPAYQNHGLILVFRG
jgi:hypothetical protein